MDDGYTHQFRRYDAEHAVKREQGCGSCPDIAACKAEGVCLAVLDEDEDGAGEGGASPHGEDEVFMPSPLRGNGAR